MGAPQRGVVNFFQAGAAQSINQIIFYSTLRSLDRMALILTKNYWDAPAVSTELVKFLSMNTSVEAVDKLVDQMREPIVLPCPGRLLLWLDLNGFKIL